MATETISVIATGNPVPFERDPQRTIGKDPVAVPKTDYYMRRIVDGELQLSDSPAGKVK